MADTQTFNIEILVRKSKESASKVKVITDSVKQQTKVLAERAKKHEMYTKMFIKLEKQARKEEEKALASANKRESAYDKMWQKLLTQQQQAQARAKQLEQKRVNDALRQIDREEQTRLAAHRKQEESYNRVWQAASRFGIQTRKSVVDAEKTRTAMQGLANQAAGAGRGFKGSMNAAINFNRVISDAPYGIIGVANNLEGLIFSLRSFDAQGKITANSVKQLLVSSFTGPGALLTIVTAVATAGVVYARFFKNMGKEAEQATKSVGSFVRRIDDLSNSIDSLDEIDKQNTRLRSQLTVRAELTQQVEKQRKELARLINIERGLRSGGGAVLGVSLSPLAENSIENLQTVNKLSKQIEESEEFIAEINEEIKQQKKAQETIAYRILKAQKDFIKAQKEAKELFENGVASQKSYLSGLSEISDKDADRVTNLETQLQFTKQLTQSAIDSGAPNERIVALLNKQTEFRKDLNFWQSETGQALLEQIKLEENITREKAKQAAYAKAVADARLTEGRYERGTSVEGETDLVGDDVRRQQRVNQIMGRGNAPNPLSANLSGALSSVNMPNAGKVDPEALKVMVDSMTNEEFTTMQFQLEALGTSLQAVSQGFANAFVDSLSGVENFTDAMRAMADGVVESLKAVIKQLLRVFVLQKLTGFLVGVGVNPAFMQTALGARNNFATGGGFRFTPNILGGAGNQVSMTNNTFLDGTRVNQTLNFGNLSQSQKFGG